MKRNLKGYVVFFFFIFCFTLLSSAQVRLKGEISGLVTDDKEEPLPGVTATLTGEKLFQNSLSQVSSEKGIVRFLNLNPGNYQLEFVLQGFNTVKVQNIFVHVGQSTPVHAVLVPETVRVEVTVVAQAPLIETKTSQISTHFSEVLVETIPTPRRIMDFLDATPGINDKGAFGAGGNYDGNAYEQGSYLTYAQGSLTTAVRLNGVDVGNPGWGNTWANPNYDTIEEIQVVGIGASAEYGNFTGATFNIVTKSGTNRLSGGFSTYYTDTSFYGDNSGGIEDLRMGNVPYHYELSAFVGGPIIKETLFFFLAGGYQGRKHKEFGAPGYDILKQPRYHLRLDWLASKSNTFSLMYNNDPINHDNLGLIPNSGTDIAYSRKFRSSTFYASWQSTLSSNTLTEIKYSRYRGRNESDPVSDQPGVLDLRTGVQSGAVSPLQRDRSPHDEVIGSVTHYVDDFLNSTHEFKFGLEYEKSAHERIARNVGGRTMAIVPQGPVDMIWAMEGYELHGKPEVERISGFVQDNIRLNSKITVNLGLRYDRPHLTARGFEGKVAKFSQFSPRLGFSYDINADARNVVHFSYGRFFQKLTTYAFGNSYPLIARDVYYYYSFWPPGEPQATQEWFDRAFQPQFLTRIVGAADLAEVEDGTKLPHTDVFNIGFEKQIGELFAVSVEYIHKRDRNILARADRNQHTYQEEQYTDPWLGNTVAVWRQTDPLPIDLYRTNSDWAKRNHHFMIISLKKQEVGKWNMMASFVWQRSRGNVDNDEGDIQGFFDAPDTDPNYYQNSLRWGDLSWTREYQFKFLATAQLPLGFIVSADFRLMSGNHYNAWAPGYAVGLPMLSSVFLEQRGAREYPWSKYLNMRASKFFMLGSASKLEVILDIFNVFNSDDGWYYFRWPYEVYPLSGESGWGNPHYLFPPRNLRFGVRWTFF